MQMSPSRCAEAKFGRQTHTATSILLNLTVVHSCARCNGATFCLCLTAEKTFTASAQLKVHFNHRRICWTSIGQWMSDDKLTAFLIASKQLFICACLPSRTTASLCNGRKKTASALKWMTSNCVSVCVCLFSTLDKKSICHAGDRRLQMWITTTISLECDE